MTEKSSEPVICVRGLVNRFGTETVHDGLDKVPKLGTR